MERIHCNTFIVGMARQGTKGYLRPILTATHAFKNMAQLALILSGNFFCPGCLHFHAIARWVVGVYEHGDRLSRVLFWGKLGMVTVESDDLTCPPVRPLRRDYPPGTQGACFHLYLGD